MTMEPSPQYVKRQLQLADEALDDAKYLLEGNRLKAASNRAYYAMFYAVLAALNSAGLTTPKSHSGALSVFGRYYVLTGKIDRQFARDLRDAYNLRQQSDYEVFASVGEVQVREVVAHAETFISEVKSLLGQP